MLQKLFVDRFFSVVLNMHQWLTISCGFSCLLLMTRILVTGYATYAFLVWNLFLAFVPYAISHWLWRNNEVVKAKLRLTGILLVWLLFIPNSFYILTDLFHLGKFDSAPKWFDLLLIFSFAWNGMLFGLMSIRRTEMIVEMITGRRFSLIILFAVMWLNAFGIYLGRYLRYNSWDIVMQPFSLSREMLEVLFHPLRNKMEWGMIGVYAIFMTVLYVTIKKLGENFSESIQTNIK